MKFILIYQPIALEEFNDAVLWYGERSEAAARQFIIEVKEKLDSICKNPYSFRNTYLNFRETSLKKYPFYIVYFLDEKENKVIITSIYHHKRNPKNKYLK